MSIRDNALFRSVLLLTILFLARCAVPSRSANACPEIEYEDSLPLRSLLLRAEREKKIENLEEHRATFLEGVLLFVEDKKIIERVSSGYHNFSAGFGGLSTGSGFALGPRYRNRFFSDRFSIIGSATWSFKKYQQYELSFLTHLHKSRALVVRVDSRYSDFPEEDFFGGGADARLEDETSYGLEERMVSVGVGFEPIRGVSGAVYSGFQRQHTGRGSSNLVPSVEEVFASADARAFSETVDYLPTKIELKVDLRDESRNPRSGIALLFDHERYKELDGDKYGYDLTSFEFQGYLPLLHKHRVFVLRLLGVNASPKEGNRIPFNDLPAVGGGASLRGFKEKRFQDRKAVVANLEYRFEAFIGLDVALFADFGQSAEVWDDVRLGDLRSSYGTGFRFNTARRILLRIDIGRSVEGTRFFFKFGHVF